MDEVFPDTARTEGSHLFVGGCDTFELAARFGTPLMIVDRATVEARAKAFASVVTPDHVYYAGKAFCCVAILEVVKDLGLSLDVCSGGELATALTAGFPPDRILFHGNNKSETELEMARDAGVGRIVVDSFDELDRIAAVGVQTDLLVRLTPGVEAHTHEFVQTGQEDSKFGFTLAEDVALEAVTRAMAVPGCKLVGVHAHIGSQIFELAAFDLAIQRLATFLAEARERVGFVPRELNLGGGFGVAHTRDEMTPDPAESAARLVAAVDREFRTRSLTVPDVYLEPGRALVGSSAVTLYKVGTIKRIPGVRTYVSVDGGMSDNIRPALYGARYEARLAARMDAPEGPRVTIAGKHCESGDILIRDAHLPADVAPGDLLVIPATGAYTYSMANNYNRLPRPGIVMVGDGAAVEIVRRETYEDVLRLDHHADGSPIS
jgi:diaminopimelate decarboxylase